MLSGRDLLGIAQTGTGKTAAFALPILDRLGRKRFRVPPRHARVLVLTPTRELASQIDASFGTYGRHIPLNRVVMFGGVGQRPQVKAMERGVDVLVATPGRLLDLMGQGFVSLSKLEVFVLDEADRMLDMGFITDIRKVMAHLPPERQTLLFSATMPQEISALAEGLLKDPLRVEVTPSATTVERVQQKVYLVEKGDKARLLQDLLGEEGIRQALVFTRTKHGANRLAEELEGHQISVAAIHGNKSQGAREAALKEFRDGRVRVLVATDIAARGLDVPGVSHVINFDLPNVPESYVHRIGRTARAGREGWAISFCDATERSYLRDIERTIRASVFVDADHPYHSTAAELPPLKQGSRSGGQDRRGTGQTTSRRSFSVSAGRGEQGGQGRGGENRGNRRDASAPVAAADSRGRERVAGVHAPSTAKPAVTPGSSRGASSMATPSRGAAVKTAPARGAAVKTAPVVRAGARGAPVGRSRRAGV